MNMMLIASAMLAVVSFKDAAKIKSWDAWSDHMAKVAITNVLQKEKPCVTWRKLNALDVGSYFIYHPYHPNPDSSYVESALANPQIVGVHWHQFSDQATSGRFDGEYLQVGWTDVCDSPYEETVKALRQIDIYATRGK